MNLIVIDILEEPLEELKGELEKEYGVTVHSIVMDLTNLKGDSWQLLQKELLENEVGVVVNNAGIMFPSKTFHQSDLQQSMDILTVNNSTLVKVGHFGFQGSSCPTVKVLLGWKNCPSCIPRSVEVSLCPRLEDILGNERVMLSYIIWRVVSNRILTCCTNLHANKGPFCMISPILLLLLLSSVEEATIVIKQSDSVRKLINQAMLKV